VVFVLFCKVMDVPRGCTVMYPIASVLCKGEVEAAGDTDADGCGGGGGGGGTEEEEEEDDDDEEEEEEEEEEDDEDEDDDNEEGVDEEDKVVGF
jgi:hypothetical protein